MALSIQVQPAANGNETDQQTEIKSYGRATAGALHNDADTAHVAVHQEQIDQAVAEANRLIELQRQRYPGGRDSLKHHQDVIEYDRLQRGIDAAKERARVQQRWGEQQIAKRRNPDQQEGEVKRNGKTVMLQLDS